MTDGDRRCDCPAPDWYHDGLSTYVAGRLCRKCGGREGYNPDHDPYHRSNRTGTTNAQ